MGPRTVRTSGYPAGDWLPTTPVDVPSYPIAAEPLALPRILLPSPGAWLEGRLQLVVGGSAACAGEPLAGQAALAPYRPSFQDYLPLMAMLDFFSTSNL